MSEKIRLTAQPYNRLPDLDGESAVRFCPKCGRRIPPEQQLCAFCANTHEIPRPKLPRKTKLLILGALILMLLVLLLGLDFAVRSAGPIQPAAVPAVRGTAVPVIMVP